MALAAEPAAEAALLKEDSQGVIRVAGTRVPLERVVLEWKAGASPEGIAESFPILELADIYAAIAYYLRHRQEVEAYIGRAEEEAERLRAEIEKQFPQTGLRERLLARMKR
jgi:uncharacterized protein (DUF433 family)